MNLFQQLKVRDPERAAAAIPVIDYGPYFAGQSGALAALPPRERPVLLHLLRLALRLLFHLHRLRLQHRPIFPLGPQTRFCASNRQAPVTAATRRTRARAHAAPLQLRQQAGALPPRGPGSSVLVEGRLGQHHRW